MSRRVCDSHCCNRRGDAALGRTHEHEHTDNRCSSQILGLAGCPGDGHCEAWIAGAYRAGEMLREIRSRR